MREEMPMSTLEELTEEHEAILLDVTGVLTDKAGAIPHAPQYISHLNESNKSYFILTNICSDTEAGIFKRLRRNGIPLLSPTQVISAGSLLQKHISTSVEPGLTVGMIGPQSCHAVVETGKHKILSCDELEEFDVLAILDDEGFRFRETLEAALSACVRKFRQTGTLPQFLLANSDSTYPLGSSRYAFGSGIFATMLSEALKKLIGAEPDVLLFGKPSQRMFAEARRRSGSGSMMMLGDQIATDIFGANTFGITSVLLLTGLNSEQDVFQNPALAPDYMFKDLRIRGANHTATTHFEKKHVNGANHHVSI
jgi:HAD superfamily hydrolase (TIGR01450 family)